MLSRDMEQAPAKQPWRGLYFVVSLLTLPIRVTIGRRIFERRWPFG